MCLIAFAIGASPQWPLVIASNRDEFLSRPTAPLARWSSHGKTIISGRDLHAGGTWLGMTPGGRIGFLTNVREPFAIATAATAAITATARSRGELVLRWLEGQQNASDIESFSHELQVNANDYAGFNLVLGDFQHNTWTWLSNRQLNEPHALHVQTLVPGVYGLSNASLDTPWPKTTALKAALTSAIAAPTLGALQAPLWTALASRRRDNGLELFSSSSSFNSSGMGLPGQSLAPEDAFSSAFVDVPDRAYGTRCSSLLIARASELNESESQSEGDKRWDVEIEERTHVRNTDRLENSNDGLGVVSKLQTTWHQRG